MHLTLKAIGQASSIRKYLSGIERNSFQPPVGPVFTTSYTKLSVLVEDEFENFNDFIFWKSPIPDISTL